MCDNKLSCHYDCYYKFYWKNWNYLKISNLWSVITHTRIKYIYWIFDLTTIRQTLKIYNNFIFELPKFVSFCWSSSDAMNQNTTFSRCVFYPLRLSIPNYVLKWTDTKNECEFEIWIAMFKLFAVENVENNR